MKVITRKEAITKGLKFYYSGKQCKNGHLVERYVVNYNCVLCSKKDAATHQQNNPEYLLEWNRSDRKNHPEKRKQWRNNNKDKIYAQDKIWRDNNKEILKKYRIDNKEVLTTNKKKWKSENAGKVNEANSRRRARKICASPVWAQKSRLLEIYNDCQELNLIAKAAGCSELFHVDHIVPLLNAIVCGLHVEYNLQIITASKNLQKGNTWNPDNG